VPDILSEISLKINSPTGETLPGRGFYQLEEDALYVPVGEHDPSRRFFSYLESKRVRFDIDRSGSLMLIEIDFARRHWAVDNSLAALSIAEPADIRWLDFRCQMPDPELITDPQHSLLLMRFVPNQTWQWYSLADNVLVQTDSDGHLTALMVTAIDDDLAGRQIAAFRKLISRNRDIVTGNDQSARPISG